MIASLHGILLEKLPDSAVIECGGVGYEVQIPVGTYNELPKTEEECFLYVRHVVREDDEMLYGFSSKDERNVFDMLMGVSGVGPKSAIAILSGITVSELKRAIAEGNVKRLGSVKGIGKKTAERIIVDLRGKINPLEAMTIKPPAGKEANTGIIQDAVLALSQLGFPQEAATKMVQTALDKGAKATDTGDLVRQALASRN